MKAESLKKSVSAVKKFFRRPASEQLFYMEVVLWLALSRLSLLLFPFKYIVSFLGDRMQEPGRPHQAQSIEKSISICRKIDSVSRYLPWECECLVQAVAGKQILKNHGIVSTMCLGLDRDDKGNIIAHAWLRVGKTVILGGREAARFSVISSFT